MEQVIMRILAKILALLLIALPLCSYAEDVALSVEGKREKVIFVSDPFEEDENIKLLIEKVYSGLVGKEIERTILFLEKSGYECALVENSDNGYFCVHNVLVFPKADDIKFFVRHRRNVSLYSDGDFLRVEVGSGIIAP